LGCWFLAWATSPPCVSYVVEDPQTRLEGSPQWWTTKTVPPGTTSVVVTTGPGRTESALLLRLATAGSDMRTGIGPSSVSMPPGPGPASSKELLSASAPSNSDLSPARTATALSRRSYHGGPSRPRPTNHSQGQARGKTRTPGHLTEHRDDSDRPSG
jgi:hypothetical protein